MKRRNKGMHFALAIFALTFSFASCTQSANYQKHEQVEMVTQPSGQDTDWSLYEDMEGGR